MSHHYNEKIWSMGQKWAKRMLEMIKMAAGRHLEFDKLVPLAHACASGSLFRTLKATSVPNFSSSLEKKLTFTCLAVGWIINHLVGPSGHGWCSDVFPPLSVSNQLLESNSVSSCGNAIQWHTSSSQILFYVVHRPLLLAFNRSLSCWLPLTNYGWPPLLVHSEICPYHFILLFRTVFSARAVLEWSTE